MKKQQFLTALDLIFMLVKQSLVDFYYVDESGFGLRPYIPYGYQPKGEQWSFPSVHKKVTNVLSFLNPFNNHLVTFHLPEGQNMNSEMFIQYMNEFTTKITQKTVLVLDNASWHTSALTKSMIPMWESQGLYLLYLPPYCPHLNKIETLWRKIKYEWLSIKDYRSEKTLKKKLDYIFKTYGLDYCIKFSMNFSDSK